MLFYCSGYHNSAEMSDNVTCDKFFVDQFDPNEAWTDDGDWFCLVLISF